ncbi:MAG: hypothetical protein K0R82_2900, partial [Flavipsychrobacter sp.]|nr:hypothetical protein [Flavipsychrobacter sp.]
MKRVVQYCTVISIFVCTGCSEGAERTQMIADAEDDVILCTEDAQAASIPANIPAGTSLSAFQPTIINSRQQAGDPPDGMAWIPGGEFSMGYSDTVGPNKHAGINDAQPVHRVSVSGFYMDKTEVTNADFAAFVNATGYMTIAERAPTQEEFPDAPAENLFAG